MHRKSLEAAEQLSKSPSSQHENHHHHLDDDDDDDNSVAAMSDVEEEDCCGGVVEDGNSLGSSKSTSLIRHSSIAILRQKAVEHLKMIQHEHNVQQQQQIHNVANNSFCK
jgi:hypothetical protein